jgi:hypothetical protein
VGEQRVLTSGFSADRSRELTLRDTRQLTKPQHTLSLDVSSGILVPLYDPDTNMIFLSGECSQAARAAIQRRGSILSWTLILSVYGADTIAIDLSLSALIS